MSTANWDQADYVARAESLEAECAVLEARLVAAGGTPEPRPAKIVGDIVLYTEVLESHVPKLRVMTDLAERRTRVAARPQALTATPAKPHPVAHTVQTKSPSAPQKPRAMTLTEKCRAAKAGNHH